MDNYYLSVRNCTKILGISRDYEHFIRSNNTIGTIATSLLIAAFAIAFAFSILFIGKKEINRLMFPYFILLGIVYAIEAVSGLLFFASIYSQNENNNNTTSSEEDNTQLQIMAHFFLIFSLMSLLYASIQSLVIKVVFSIAGIGAILTLVYSMVRRRHEDGDDDYYILFYYYNAIYLLVMMVQIWKDKYLSATGCLLIIIGSLIYLGLNDRCKFKQEEYYDQCFEKCPLPSPWIFDHRAVRNLFLAFGLILQAFGETKENNDIRSNTTSHRNNRNNNDNNALEGDEQTVDADDSEFSEDISV